VPHSRLDQEIFGKSVKDGAGLNQRSISNSEKDLSWVKGPVKLQLMPIGILASKTVLISNYLNIPPVMYEILICNVKYFTYDFSLFRV
jgi:hypothetical protein